MEWEICLIELARLTNESLGLDVLFLLWVFCRIMLRWLAFNDLGSMKDAAPLTLTLYYTDEWEIVSFTSTACVEWDGMGSKSSKQT